MDACLRVPRVREGQPKRLDFRERPARLTRRTCSAGKEGASECVTRQPQYPREGKSFPKGTEGNPANR